MAHLVRERPRSSQQQQPVAIGNIPGIYQAVFPISAKSWFESRTQTIGSQTYWLQKASLHGRYISYSGTGSGQTFNAPAVGAITDPIGFLGIFEKPTATAVLGRATCASVNGCLIGFDATNGWYVTSQPSAGARTANSSDFRDSGVFFGYYDPISGDLKLFADGVEIASSSNAPSNNQAKLSRLDIYCPSSGWCAMAATFYGTWITNQKFIDALFRNPWRAFASRPRRRAPAIASGVVLPTLSAPSFAGRVPSVTITH